MTTLEFRTKLPVSARDAFAWHARPGALERLTPPWERVRVISHTGGIEPGARVELESRLGPLPLRWSAVHGECVPGVRFVDEQARGPFAAWKHEHLFHDETAGEGSELIDRVTFALPGGAIGRVFGEGYVRRRLARLFAYRHATTAADLALWKRGRGAPRRRVAITGGSGLVGRALAPLLTTQGHEVVRFVRGAVDRPGTAGWDPARGTIDEAALSGCDALVHLSGENVAGGRWTDARRRAIIDSRLGSTRLLAEALARAPRKPRVWVCASATGFYGNAGERVCAEDAANGSGFLAEVTRDWEAATAPAREAGVRVVNLRIGVVLTPGGGALAKMLPAFRVGLGGPLGGGRQWLSWISLDDLCGVIVHALGDEALHGPVNAVAPVAIPQAEFAAILGGVLRRPSFAPVPAFVLRALFGAMADETVLSSTRAVPRVLQERGFVFRDATLEAALRHSLGRAER